VGFYINMQIGFLVFASIIGYTLILYFTRKTTPSDSGDHSHNFDGIEELNEPLPAWWVWLFVLTIIYSVVYLILYPGLGDNTGFLKWNSQKACTDIIKQRDAQYQHIYLAYSKMRVEDLSTNLRALKIGKSLFINNCSICHGLDARGGNGFPNLTNNKWLYGGTPNEIRTSITNGRKGRMPPYGSVIGGEDILESTAYYVLSLSTKDVPQNLTSTGKLKFNTICSACHSLNAKGNKFIGAPDLTDPQWVYGGDFIDIKNSIKNGRHGVMPSHKDVLSKEQIHILTAYIFSLNKI